MLAGMKTLATMVTERGQVSIPAEIRKKMKLKPGQRILWELTPDGECRITPAPVRRPQGACAMLGYASTFRRTRRTQEWMDELRGGEEA
jgi:AbrB family looped-hinge helix DNA binding protein